MRNPSSLVWLHTWIRKTVWCCERQFNRSHPHHTVSQVLTTHQLTVSYMFHITLRHRHRHHLIICTLSTYLKNASMSALRVTYPVGIVSSPGLLLHQRLLANILSVIKRFHQLIITCHLTTIPSTKGTQGLCWLWNENRLVKIELVRKKKGKYTKQNIVKYAEICICSYQEKGFELYFFFSLFVFATLITKERATQSRFV